MIEKKFLIRKKILVIGRKKWWDFGMDLAGPVGSGYMDGLNFFLEGPEGMVSGEAF